jgi:hypothetical protein
MRSRTDGVDYATVLSRHYETNWGYKLENKLPLRRDLPAN